ncbi:MAG: flagellar assembly protein FliH [Sulfurospirillum sp.]
MDNVIEQDELNKHTIQRYRFKVLGSVKTEEENEDDFAQEVETDKKSKMIQKDSIDKNQNQFIEELLKKSDILSSNIIKLQMQIEKQESEFENRLKESVAREKEISFDEGYSKAKEELELSYNERVSNYIESAKKLEEKSKSFDNFFKKVEKNIIDTSLEVAREVIKKEVSGASSQVAHSLAKELIKDLKDASKITIKVNPKDFDALNDIFAQNAKIDVQSDTAVSLGGVILLSDSGNLDGNISARLEKVKYLLQNESND